MKACPGAPGLPKAARHRARLQEGLKTARWLLPATPTQDSSGPRGANGSREGPGEVSIPRHALPQKPPCPALLHRQPLLLATVRRQTRRAQHRAACQKAKGPKEAPTSSPDSLSFPESRPGSLGEAMSEADSSPCASRCFSSRLSSSFWLSPASLLTAPSQPASQPVQRRGRLSNLKPSDAQLLAG
jgi:hypothetical protein